MMTSRAAHPILPPLPSENSFLSFPDNGSLFEEDPEKLARILFYIVFTVLFSLLLIFSEYLKWIIL